MGRDIDWPNKRHAIFCVEFIGNSISAKRPTSNRVNKGVKFNRSFFLQGLFHGQKGRPIKTGIKALS